MFIPLGDDNSDRRIRPVVNVALIGLNLLVFFTLQGMGSGGSGGGVAYGAHIGGFIAGLVLVKFFLIGRSQSGGRRLRRQ